MLPITTAEESGGAGAGAGTTASFTPIVGQLPQGYSVQGHDLVKELLRINYEPVFIETFTDLMRKKLGLRRGGVATDLQNLILPLLQLLADTGVDYTVFFRALCDFRVAEVDFRLHAHGEVKPPAIGDKKIKSRPMCSKTCRSLLIEGITARIAEEQAEEKRKAEDEAKKSERGGGVSRKHSMANVQASLAGLMPTNTVSESLSRRPSHRLSVVVVEDDKQDAVVVVEGDKRGKNKGEQDIRQRLTEGGDKINNNNDSIPSPLSTSEEEVFLPLPTVDEVKSRWAEWATKYRDRLVEENHVYPQPSTVEQIDSLRSEAMRKANPRYVLRNWILDDLSDRLIQQGIHTIYPPPFFHNGGVTDGVGGGMVAGTDGDNSSSSDAVKEALDRMRIEIDRVVHVLIADVYGDVADSLKGWSAVEKMASESWYEEIVDGEVGNINAKSSCL